MLPFRQRNVLLQRHDHDCTKPVLLALPLNQTTPQPLRTAISHLEHGFQIQRKSRECSSFPDPEGFTSHPATQSPIAVKCRKTSCRHHLSPSPSPSPSLSPSPRLVKALP